ncbi:GntR family transcriptional regulator [Streptomyces sp. ZS0098]|uniref:MocR-like pyridoxine biosynthesis transcription factor PdxR n=1 Tax=Streptomyces sp. ZS0098 TaxID=1904044 RepID=UPI000EFC929E|nr:PLP-dependent aminotransferase family protein [Streptomyces sp. ZS0098]RMI90209.1 GntR family transcriptional regulator [Streptomyces sp. ZS0098]
MAERWATFGIDLHLDPSGPGLRRGLTDALREAVRGGRLAPGTRLPSSRSLAADLGIARNTVADAYADLIAEGWLTARQGSGTRVAPRAVPERPAAPTPRRTPGRLPYSLMPGTPDLASFPRAEWLRATRRALTAAPHDAFGYGDPRGRPELREALAGYLSRVRGVRADPGHVVVCSGFSHGLQLLSQVLRARTLAVEPYGLDVHWDLVHRAGLKTAPLARDTLGTRAQDPGDAEAVLLSPAHQFPLGGALLPERRAAVVEWARRTGGLILEDDYDGEFRYDRQPVGALQDLDPGRVAHLGTVSKSLAPGLRLGWMVVPPWLLPDVVDHGGGRTVSVVEQLALAEFLTSGAYDRQVRAARLRYRRRRDALVKALAAGAPHVRVTGIAAGLHAVLELPPGTERSVQRSATWQGLAVKGLDSFRHPGVTDPVGDALVVGYATPPDHAWTGTLDALLRSLP